MFGEIVGLLLKRDFSPSTLTYMPFNITGKQDCDGADKLSEKSLDIVEYITNNLVL
ncbi:hypothetical protein [Wolbachia pipientis]|uniref:hypothetical protein n=1 Tax=Wolbachia pipientis TaxID=955 RepID=UPI0025A4C77E|nr:hypothetical protein [Wolbachia pipientis]MDM8335131.1 hypothetical protein [Wolbachia pipientis]